MGPDQITSLRASFDKLWPVNQRFAETFYVRLFELKTKSPITLLSRFGSAESKTHEHACDHCRSSRQTRDVRFHRGKSRKAGAHSLALRKSITQRSAKP